jgi:hypothetical protein
MFHSFIDQRTMGERKTDDRTIYLPKPNDGADDADAPL